MSYFRYITENHELKKAYDYYCQFSDNPHLNLYKHLKSLYAGFGQITDCHISDDSLINALAKFEEQNIKFYN